MTPIVSVFRKVRIALRVSWQAGDSFPEAVMVPFAVAERILDRALNVPEDLERINQSLADRGLPVFYLGATSFNTQYRIANKPRYVWRWRPPGLRLAEFYLCYMPNIAPGTEPQPSDEIVIRL